MYIIKLGAQCISLVGKKIEGQSNQPMMVQLVILKSLELIKAMYHRIILQCQTKVGNSYTTSQYRAVHSGSLKLRTVMVY